MTTDNDFHISTKDVKDNFTATVKVTAEEGWKLVEPAPNSESENFAEIDMTVGGKVDWKVVKNTEDGKEDEAGGEIILFKVDVEIGGVGEEDEVKVGAFAAFSQCPSSGTLDEDNINALVSVKIRCLPEKREEDYINITYASGHLYEKIDGDYQLADESYPVEGISERKFYLHGHDVSQTLRDFEITAVHSLNECSDTANYTVVSVDIDETEIEFFRGEEIYLPIVVLPAGALEHVSLSVSGFDDIHWSAEIVYDNQSTYSLKSTTKKEGMVFLNGNEQSYSPAIRLTNLIDPMEASNWEDEQRLYLSLDLWNKNGTYTKAKKLNMKKNWGYLAHLIYYDCMEQSVNIIDNDSGTREYITSSWGGMKLTEKDGSVHIIPGTQIDILYSGNERQMLEYFKGNFNTFYQNITGSIYEGKVSKESQPWKLGVSMDFEFLEGRIKFNTDTWDLDVPIPQFSKLFDFSSSDVLDEYKKAYKSAKKAIDFYSNNSFYGSFEDLEKTTIKLSVTSDRMTVNVDSEFKLSFLFIHDRGESKLSWGIAAQIFIKNF